MKKYLRGAAITFIGILIGGPAVLAQDVITLYPGLAPYSQPVKNTEKTNKPVNGGRSFVSNVTVPTLTVFIPEHQNASRTSVIICPGGGYSRLSIEDGGYEAGKALAAAGITSFVLKYRTWMDSAYTDYRYAPITDLRKAQDIVFNNSGKWNLDTSHIGILGFSAGGHLTAMAATSAGSRKIAFTFLIYPVISFLDELTSKTSTSRNTLIGKKSDQKEKEMFSPELHVTGNTPVSFIVQAEDDSTSLVGNSMAYYQALVKNHIAAQLLLYQKGGHGFALYNKAQDEYWLPAALKWLALNKLYEIGQTKK